ncbi:hypothetical protein [Streptomyces sp. NPDC002851]
MRISRRLSSTAIAGVASIAVLAPAGSAFADSHVAAKPAAVQAADAQAAKKIPAKLTPGSYKKYLKNQRTPQARITLKAFNRLSASKQKRFVKHLQNRNIYKALTNRVKGQLNQPKHVVDPYNKDVKFVTDVKSVTIKDGRGTTRTTFSVSERIYNIPVTTETVTVKFATIGKKQVLGKVTANAKVNNVNAAIAITAGPVKASVNGTVRTGKVAFTATPQVKAFGRKVVKDDRLSVNYTKKAKTFLGSLTNR